MGAIRRGMRNAFRNTTRTVAIVLVLSIAFALAIGMFVANRSAGQRVSAASSDLGTTIVVTPAGSFGGFSFGGNPLTSADVTTVTDTPGVVATTATDSGRLDGAGSSSSGFGGGFSNGTTSLTSPLTLGSIGRQFSGGSGNSGGYRGGYTPPNPNTPLPITVIGTTNLDDAAALHATSITLTAGSAIDGSSSADVADVGSTLASKNDLKVGSTFTAYGTTITVAGIFNANEPDANAEFIVPLKTLQTLSDQSGVTEIDAQASSLGAVTSVANAITSRLGGATKVNVTTSQSNSSTVANDLSSIKSISLFSLIGAIVAAIAILVLAMLLVVRERRREIGILKAFGSSNGGVVAAFAAEGVTLTLIAGVVGVIVGLLISNPLLDALKPSSGGPGGGRFGGGFGGHGFGGFGGFQFNSGSLLTTRGLSNLHAVFSGSVIAYCVVAVIGVALLGSMVPAYLTSKVRPAEALRSEG